MNLDLALLLASIIFTVLLAFVGIEMANNPPTSSKARWMYRVAFIVLGSLLIGTTYWQGKRNIDEQTKTQAEAAKQEKKLDDRYNEVKGQYSKLEGRLISIQNFTKHPPASFTPQQVSEAVRVMAGTGDLKQRTLNLCQEITIGVANREQDLLRLRKLSTPLTPAQQHDLDSSVSGWFRWKFMNKVKAIRAEYAELHRKNEKLDEFLYYDDRLMETLRPGEQPPILRSYDYETIVNGLTSLAQELKD